MRMIRKKGVVKRIIHLLNKRIPSPFIFVTVLTLNSWLNTIEDIIDKLIEVLAGLINIDALLLMMGTEIFLVPTPVTE